ncbi:MAG: FAD binding domain-containing protein [Treponema sp.]|nr:FAD binding domain-containing protein [Treponema sp.]
MEETEGKFLIADSLSHILFQIKANKTNDLRIVGACTQMADMNCTAVSTRNIQELKNIEKRERYIDFGPAVTLGQMSAMGRNNIPSVLYDAIQSTATGPIRNIATLAGNICREGQKGTLFAPLLALDTKLEVKLLPLDTKHAAKNPTFTKSIPLSKLAQIPQPFVLSKIRVPLNDWGISIFTRLGPEGKPTPLNASFVFLMDTENDLLVNMKVAFTGPLVFHSRELENKLIGSKLPLSDKAIGDFLATAESLSKEEFEESKAAPILKEQFLSLLDYHLQQLS